MLLWVVLHSGRYGEGRINAEVVWDGRDGGVGDDGDGVGFW